MKSGLNNSTPKRYPHLDLRLKKIQVSFSMRNVFSPGLCLIRFKKRNKPRSITIMNYCCEDLPILWNIEDWLIIGMNINLRGKYLILYHLFTFWNHFYCYIIFITVLIMVIEKNSKRRLPTKTWKLPNTLILYNRCTMWIIG